MTPNFTLTPETIRAWYDFFSNESATTFGVALQAVMKQPGRIFFPSPGEVVLLINEAQNKNFPPAGLIWDEICTYAQFGYDIDKVLELLKGNPVAISALRQVGYREIRYCNYDGLIFRKRDFERYYDRAVESYEVQKRIELSKEESKKFLSSITAPSGIKSIEQSSKVKS